MKWIRCQLSSLSNHPSGICKLRLSGAIKVTIRVQSSIHLIFRKRPTTQTTTNNTHNQIQASLARFNQKDLCSLHKLNSLLSNLFNHPASTYFTGIEAVIMSVLQVHLPIGNRCPCRGYQTLNFSYCFKDPFKLVPVPTNLSLLSMVNGNVPMTSQPLETTITTWTTLLRYLCHHRSRFPFLNRQ